jgi:hypothetical protein
MHIAGIEIIGNGANANPANRVGFGFDSVNVAVNNSSGTAVFNGYAGLPGSPDPDTSFKMNVLGRVVVLTFNGHESPDCGGFAELRVFAT